MRLVLRAVIAEVFERLEAGSESARRSVRAESFGMGELSRLLEG